MSLTEIAQEEGVSLAAVSKSVTAGLNDLETPGLNAAKALSWALALGEKSPQWMNQFLKVHELMIKESRNRTQRPDVIVDIRAIYDAMYAEDEPDEQDDDESIQTDD